MLARRHANTSIYWYCTVIKKITITANFIFDVLNGSETKELICAGGIMQKSYA